MTQEERPDDNVYGDEYDVFGKAITVHTRGLKESGINEDFKMSDLKERKQMMVRRSMILTRHIKAFLDYSRHLKSNKKKFIEINGEKVPTRGISAGITEEELIKVNNISRGINARLTEDLGTLAVLSSATDGRIIKGTIHRLKQEGKSNKEDETLGDKLKPKKEEEGGGM